MTPREMRTSSQLLGGGSFSPDFQIFSTLLASPIMRDSKTAFPLPLFKSKIRRFGFFKGNRISKCTRAWVSTPRCLSLKALALIITILQVGYFLRIIFPQISKNVASSSPSDFSLSHFPLFYLRHGLRA